MNPPCLTSLPPELLLQIFEAVDDDPASLISLSHTNRTFYSAIKSPTPQMTFNQMVEATHHPYFQQQGILSCNGCRSLRLAEQFGPDPWVLRGSILTRDAEHNLPEYDHWRICEECYWDREERHGPFIENVDSWNRDLDPEWWVESADDGLQQRMRSLTREFDQFRRLLQTFSKRTNAMCNSIRSLQEIVEKWPGDEAPYV